MNFVPTAPVGTAAERGEIVSRFVALSALAGLLLGIFEAALLRTTPGIMVLLVPDIGLVEWFLAPVLDMACFGLWGLLLGWMAARRPGKHRTALLVAADVAAVAAWVVLRLHWLHARAVMVKFAFARDVLIPLALYAAGVAVSLLAVYLLWKPVSRLAGRLRFKLVRFLSYGLGLAGVVGICGIGIFLVNPFRGSAPSGTESSVRFGDPNIIFIVLDTVRADHLSSYGYSRPTTPNIDKLARRGVLFENAIAATSWTLASHASMFTGLLPHQHGADWAVPLLPGPRTLAEVLGSHGYETAGFVANLDYCQKGWGIGRGFGLYVDDSDSFRHNLAGTLVGTALVQTLYQHFWRYDMFERQDAGEINDEVFRWLRRRARRPFFLFINYFDAHAPYLTQPPYDHRFGRIPARQVHRLFDALETPDHPRGITPADRATLIDGYDNCLAYLDAQVGRLLHVLRKSPEGKNTIVIITSDHGEEFGEQGWYSHGYNLYREALHVPLIIAGPGIPKDVRIRHLVRTRDLFSTVLDLAGGGNTPFSRESLARFWNPDFTPRPFDDFVVSELGPILHKGGKSDMISLTTPQWQYIRNSDGRQDLYHWTADPLDRTNLAESSGAQAALKRLRQRLIQVVADSSEPWRGPNYLFAHSGRGSTFLNEIIGAQEPPQTLYAHKRHFIGAAQALLGPEETTTLPKPGAPDRETLKSLPYQ
ncbi:MAG: sulfatase-like hydrolase/transferase [Acidobacteriota bacterium]